MTAIVGVIIFTLGVFAGIWLAGVTLFAIHQIASDLAVKSEPENPVKPTPVVEIPVMLDAERIVEVGFSQALQEEAARIARWN